MKRLRKLLAGALLLCMLSAMLVAPAAAAGPSLSISNSPNYLHTVDKTFTLQAAASDSGTPTIRWRSDKPEVLAVEDETSGKLTVKGVGTAEITAEAAGYTSASVSITVLAAELIDMPETLNLAVNGDSASAAAKVKWRSDSPVTYTSEDSDIAAVDPDTGLVTPKKAGTTIITATASDDLCDPKASATCTVTVVPPVLSVLSTPQGWSALAFSYDDVTNGTTITLEAKQDRAGGSGDYRWSVSDNKVIELSPVDGNSAQCTVKPLATGICQVEVSRDGCKSYSYQIKVQGVNGFSLDKTELTLTVGEQATLTPSVSLYDTDVRPSISWNHSHEEIAKVDNNGTVTAVAPGEATITATVDGRTVFCTVKVVAAPVPVDGVTVYAGESSGSFTLTKGSHIALHAVVTPEDASDKLLTWSLQSGSDYVSFDPSTQKVTAKAAGEAVIRATAANGKYGEITIKVPVADATGIRILDKNDLVIPTGGTKELKAELTPAHSTDAITWSSSKDSVATVDPVTGLVTGVAPGTVTITATAASGKKDTCKITVLAAATGIDLKNTSITLDVGGSASISAKIIPSGAYGKLIYTSTEDGKTDPIFTVDKNGKVTAKRPGVGTVTVSAHNGIGKDVSVTVKEKTVTGIALNTGSVAVDSTIPLDFKVTPADYTDTLEWTSDNTSYAEIISNTQIKGVSKGVVSITVTAKSKLDNRVTFTKSFDITVTTPPSKTGTLTLTASPNVISSVGGYSKLAAKVGDVLIPNNYISWSVSPSSSGAATVNTNGVVTPKSAGDVIITGVYDDVANDVRYTGSVLVRIAPIIVYGNYGSYDRVNPLYFSTNEVIHAWNPAVDRVVVDGYVLTHGQHCYVASSPDGHVMVALNPVFLNQLSPAVVHTIQIGDPAAPAVGYFRIYGHSSTINGVKTGDESQPALWAALCIMSLLGASAILVSRRKDWKANQ